MNKPLPGNSAPRPIAFLIDLTIDLTDAPPDLLEARTDPRANRPSAPEEWDAEINSLWIDYGGEAG